LKDPERHFSGTPTSIADALAEFEAAGTGLLATQHLDAGAFISLEGDAWPSLQSIFTPGIAEFYRADGLPDTGHIYIGGYVCRPKSRGTVTLTSSNPLDRPLIDPKYFSEPDDMRMTKELIRQNIEILLSKPLREISHGDIPLNPDDDGELEAFMRRRASTSWHPTSTCRMGQDEHAVVAPDLRVRGIDRLRVCDASVMPMMISGNTNAPVIMIAEKGADIIRKARR
jgi:choline dehydrogenase